MLIEKKDPFMNLWGNKKEPHWDCFKIHPSLGNAVFYFHFPKHFSDKSVNRLYLLFASVFVKLSVYKSLNF